MDLTAAIQRHVLELPLPTGRRLGQPGHDSARRYLVRQFQALDLAPFAGAGFEIPNFEAGQRFTNIVGRVHGTDGTLPPVLIGAHYDSAVDGPSSDDNAAAVGITLEAARAPSTTPLRLDVLVACFDAEEPPYFLGSAMGSKPFYAEHLNGIRLACAVIMDLVGHDVEPSVPGLEERFPALRRLLFVMGSESRAELPAVARRAAESTPRLCVLPTLHDSVGNMSDHHAFRLSGQPFLILSCGQGKFYHSLLDTPDWLDSDKTASVCEFVLRLARELDGAESIGGSCDTVAFEIESLERATGLSRAELAASLGLEALETRADIDKATAAIFGSLLVWARALP